MMDWLQEPKDMVARRDHKACCCECQRRILKGRKFRDGTLSDRGEIYHYKVCGRCARWVDKFVAETGEIEWAHGDIKKYRFDVIRDEVRRRKKRCESKS